nr:MAG TPA: TRAF PROTEIN, TRAO PROTEIN, TRAN ADHESION, BACTERIAL SECRETION.5A [Caudoviricetes sp.]
MAKKSSETAVLSACSSVPLPLISLQINGRI